MYILKVMAPALSLTSGGVGFKPHKVILGFSAYV